jgi:hypothetical protein
LSTSLKVAKLGLSPFGAFDHYQQDAFKNFTRGMNIFVKDFDFNYGQFGNSLGCFLNEYPMANVLGAHFIMVGKIRRNHSKSRDQEQITDFFPNVVVHSVPKPRFV